MRAVDNLRAGVGFAVAPHRALIDIHRRFGPICVLGAGPSASVFMLGPEANQFVLTNSQAFRWREAFDSLVVIDGETALIVSDGADHQRRRRLVTPAFTRRQIELYADTMRTNVETAIDGWRPGQVIDLHLELRRVIRRSTIEVLFGPRLARDEPELGRLLEVAMIPVERLPPWQQLQRLGAPSWKRALRARAGVARRVADEIKHRREVGHSREVGHGRAAAPEPERPDVLNLLVGSRDEDGSGLTDLEIIDQVISLIAAGYETTSAAMASATYAMLIDQSVWERAAASVRDRGTEVGGACGADGAGKQRGTEVGGACGADGAGKQRGTEVGGACGADGAGKQRGTEVGGACGADGAGKHSAWRYVDGVVSETLRLYPPGAISARTVAEPFTFMETAVKAGQTVIFSPYVTHRLPELWPEPLQFQPERWDPLRPGFTRPGPHEFLPFGGGPHRCLGAAFATSEITVLLEALLRRTTLRLDVVDPRPVGLAAMRPRKGPLAEVLTVS